MRHTKIVATAGPASDSDAMLDAMIAAGVDVVRLNFSHGTHESHAATCKRVRAAAARAGRTVAVLQDLSGPKIRTGRIAGGAMPLAPGETLSIETGDFEGRPGRVSTTYGELARHVRQGQTLLLDDGRIVLRIIESDGVTIRTEVEHGSVLGQHKGINAPGVALPAAGLTPKDVEDLRFGLSLGVDLVAVSFVQRGEDLRHARRTLHQLDAARVPLVAKIERPEALDNLDDVLSHCEAVMVARGDLGLEMPLEQVPRVQKEITRRARARGLPVIIATQVLESMRQEPRPTRAEVSDAANAVDDGVDAIMLAGETAAGRFPVQAVETLAAIIDDAERLRPAAVDPAGAMRMQAAHGHALCGSAVALADLSGAEAIVAITRDGNTARVLASLRPRARIVAVTREEPLARRLCLYYGVEPMLIPDPGDATAGYDAISKELLRTGRVGRGAVVVFVSIHADLSRVDANYLNLQRLD